jgi:hypothetical protein
MEVAPSVAVSGADGASGALSEQGYSLVAVGTVSLTAIVHEEGDQIRQGGKICAVDDRLAVTPAGHKASVAQLLQVK